MKTLLKSIGVGLVGSLSLGTLGALADLEVSASVQIHAEADFHAPLAAHGTWIEVGTYGRCWRPASVVVGWRPYCYGHWVWTDCGWYWVSDEPWAWACYHYGWWTLDGRHGWIWIPGVYWAPAWVTWRVGGGYCGWAPLAPRHVTVAHASFVFVETKRFHDPIRPATVIVNNTAIFNKTSPQGSLKRESRDFDGGGPKQVMVNNGPDRQMIQQVTGKPVRTMPIKEANQSTAQPPNSKAVGKSGDDKQRNLDREYPQTGNPKAPGAVEEPSKPGSEQKQAPTPPPAPGAKPGKSPPSKKPKQVPK